MKTNVMIVEDQPLQRELFKLYIQNSDKYKLVCTTDNAALCDIYLLKNDIDLILMDICTAMGESGLDASERIKKKYPDVKIIVITSMADSSFIKRAKSLGIESFWYKEADEKELLEIMDLTLNGENIYPNNSLDVQIGKAKTNDFSESELNILRLIVKGKTNDEIAEETCLSYNTVRKYINILFEKTGCQNRTELAVKAVESSFISSI